MTFEPTGAAWPPLMRVLDFSVDVGKRAQSADPESNVRIAPPSSSIEAAWRFCLDVTQVRRNRLANVGARSASAQSASAQSQRPVTNLAAANMAAPALWHGAARELLDLYAPLLSLQPAQRFAIGHLAQGIDGNIATESGSSRRLSGELNHTHLHRLRALADAVVVGASTAELDDPALTVRLVQGRNPVRLVIDPSVRLPTRLQMFRDEAAPSLLVCAQSNRAAAVSRWGARRVVAVEMNGDGLNLPALFAQLQERGWPVILVEGGGVTVSRMIDAHCLDRVQVSITPIFVGGTRTGLRLTGPANIDDCPRPPPRVFRMGEDLLWDLDLRAGRHEELGRSDATQNRVI